MAIRTIGLTGEGKRAAELLRTAQFNTANLMRQRALLRISGQTIGESGIAGTTLQTLSLETAAKRSFQVAQAYYFGGGRSEYDLGRMNDGSFKPDKDILGGKGANLHAMADLGIPVPPGITIPTTETNKYFIKNRLPDELMGVVKEKMALVENETGRKFDDENNPLLLSVRSGAKYSMPGMMDTILNLGLNDKTVLGLAKATGNERFAWDSYRRFLQMFSNIVFGLEKEVLEEILVAKKAEKEVKLDTELTVGDLKKLATAYKKKLAEKKIEIPQDAWQQLALAVEAVMKSSNNTRAIEYKRMYNIPMEIVSAVNVQAMVFGNMGEDSATGVGFTRDPATGENKFYGEFLTNAQGEDVVAGIRTPRKIAELQNVLPEAYAQLREITGCLERFYRNVQDFEFTIENGKLYMLQTRDGKRTAQAALKIAVDMVEEGSITVEEALMMIEPEQMSHLLHPVFDPIEKEKVLKEGGLLGKGINASPGAAVGKIKFTAESVVLAASKGEEVLLVRKETCPDDISGMKAAQGILTGTGGATSHAAVVGRQMGKPAVVGFSAAIVSEKEKSLKIGDKNFREGDILSIDGTTGEVFARAIKTIPSEVKRVVEGKLKPEESLIYRRYMEVLGWAQKAAELEVWANADTAKDIRIADAFNAQGVGLARTEHMFFGEDRIPYMVGMILSESLEERQPFLNKILEMQKKDFISLFEVMKGRPVTIRTLDPPLHEFLPKADSDIDKLLSSSHSTELVMQLKRKLGISKEGVSREELGEELWLALRESVKRRAAELHEFNPMMGHRGCRLGITHPEITRMQARAIFEAAIAVAKKGIPVKPKVMIPLVGFAAELRDQARIVAEVHAEMEYGSIPYQIGTMIEVPRGGLTADEVAEIAEFFSFGTNDYHQYNLGFSRDDAGKFIASYINMGIIPADPTQKIDQPGTGKLMWIAVQLGRVVRPELDIGICGEHGGETTSVEFCHALGLNYVSASPYRIPVARVAAAQAAIKEGRIEKDLRERVAVLQEA